ncbi:MAG: hypothetical protein Q8K20_02485 [Gemmobacter sp.]|nr:hypothetical protein [Gemmobacter sp.]
MTAKKTDRPAAKGAGPGKPAALIAPEDRSAAVQLLAKGFAGAAGGRRLANVALRVALIRAWVPAPPPVALPPVVTMVPPPPPPRPTGKVKLMALTDVASLLSSVDEPPAPAPPPAAPKPMVIDFSMFGDDDPVPPPAPEEAAPPGAATPMPAPSGRAPKKPAPPSNEARKGRSRSKTPRAE